MGSCSASRMRDTLDKYIQGWEIYILKLVIITRYRFKKVTRSRYRY